MSNHHRRNRMVSLQSLTNRNDQSPAVPAAQVTDVAAPPPERRKRLTLADVPRPTDLHWLHVWRDGAEAALRSATPDAARALVPPSGVACRDCWQKGRDAAIKAMAPGR